MASSLKRKTPSWANPPTGSSPAPGPGQRTVSTPAYASGSTSGAGAAKGFGGVKREHGEGGGGAGDWKRSKLGGFSALLAGLCCEEGWQDEEAAK